RDAPRAGVSAAVGVQVAVMDDPGGPVLDAVAVLVVELLFPDDHGLGRYSFRLEATVRFPVPPPGFYRHADDDEERQADQEQSAPKPAGVRQELPAGPCGDGAHGWPPIEVRSPRHHPSGEGSDVCATGTGGCLIPHEGAAAPLNGGRGT